MHTMAVLLTLLLYLVAYPVSGGGQDCDVRWSVEEMWGISYQGVSLAIQEARSFLFIEPGTTLCLFLSPGQHLLVLPDQDSSLDLSGSWGSPDGRLVLEGAGMEETILIVDPHHTLLTGRNVERLTIRDLQFRRSQELTTQGRVLQVGKGFVSLEIPEGFPGLDEIYDNTSSTGRYLRQYQTVENECEIVEEDNPQVPWHDYHQGLDNTWRVILADNQLTNYKPGQIIGVKSKCCGNGHNAYWFCGG